jgi:hypothetical protein
MSHPLSIRVPPFDLATFRPERGEVTIPLLFFLGHLTRAEHSTREDDTNKSRVHNP